MALVASHDGNIANQVTQLQTSRFGDRTVLSVDPAGVERILFTKVEGRGNQQLTYALDVELSQTECEEDAREPDDSLE